MSPARPPRTPTPHPSGARPPKMPAGAVPAHVALVMDGNGRWAKQRGLTRTEGHKRGEAALFDVVEGAIEIGVTHLSAYAFSTENWKRSPEEVREGAKADLLASSLREAVCQCLDAARAIPEETTMVRTAIVA